MRFLALITALICAAAPAALAQTTAWPNQKEADYIIKDFRFADGETIPELRMHFLTLGTPKRNAAGEITNGVVLLHGTSGSGKNWLLPTLSDELIAKGQPLDASETLIINPDAIFVSASFKPS